MKLDHFVIHIDNDETILDNLKDTIEPMGFPFEPSWGKGTKGFKAANIWIGRQYFEIVRVLNRDGGGWPTPWVKRYHEGKRGLTCLYLAIDNIDEVANMLTENNITNKGPERISFSILFGLWKKTLPWRLIYLPSIPGTDFEIGFIQHDPDPKDRIKKFLVPNSDENGITGVSSAKVKLPITDESRDFISRLFPKFDWDSGGLRVALDNGHLEFADAPEIQLELYADIENPKFVGNSFSLEDVTVRT